MPSGNISITVWRMFWPTLYYNLHFPPFTKSFVWSPSYYADALFNVQDYLLSSSFPCHSYFFCFSLCNLLFILCPYSMPLFNCMINNTGLKIAWKEIFVYTSIYVSELKNTTEISSWVVYQQNDIHCCDLPIWKRNNSLWFMLFGQFC